MEPPGIKCFFGLLGDAAPPAAPPGGRPNPLARAAELGYQGLVSEKTPTRFGYAALVGLPNAGKSTLLNAILGQKLQIVTPKPQTTRDRVLAVHNEGAAQVVFLDTPGHHAPHGALGRYMLDAIEAALAEANVVVWLVDAADHARDARLGPGELAVAERLAATGRPIVVAPNKVDLLRRKEALLPLLERLAGLPGVAEAIPISAARAEGLDRLLAATAARLPAGPWLYPEEMLSDRADRFFAAERIREVITELTRKEVPYKVAVQIDRYVEQRRRVSIHASIHVERATQRAILVGKGGAMIREIGARARESISQMLDRPVDLRLHVDVSPGWTGDRRSLERLGYA